MPPERSRSRIAVIINPISGTGGRADRARARGHLAAERLAAKGIEPEVFMTERPGHARELARAAVTRGAHTVVAWGGDGTVNEVASALAFGPSALAIVPSGSGNGLARELAIPFEPTRALEIAMGAGNRLIDAGELDGHLFFNIAGVGLDARVAHRFAAGGLVRRGLARYIEITIGELLRFEPDDHTVVADGTPERTRSLLIAIANGRQYGNGALIAPNARIDDGLLDVVVVTPRSPVRALLQIPRVFMGQMAAIPGVAMRTARRIEITSAAPVIFHVDGEPFVGSASIAASVHPGALRVKVASSG